MYLHQWLLKYSCIHITSWITHVHFSSVTVVKIENFQLNFFYIFLIFAQNIEAVLTCTHNLCFGTKIRKIGIPPAYPSFAIEVGYKGVYITRTCFPDLKFKHLFSLDMAGGIYSSLSMRKNVLRGLSAPALGLYTYI